ncbi:hypothetical protein CSV79_08805 [Sporosarcina sp. P13]|uniref:S-layer homology domain-containing protein n=1 Tax=Sporosarcina sp. P13 TaxID=2048263 RepID=UPI000C171087|nr:S-layer homology domain-containing protein [Sporosarcina sp. P13]PIC64009.1 hypothetical protein CSV79_08805 [Sporosarcina sp. P13]
MANQPTKYRKFLVGAASAALVASAVAPVASAADFSDTKGNTHEPAIDALSDAGVISGYPDGSFKPNNTLTRSDVVKLMGKWLIKEGRTVPTDYKTNPRFTDLTSKSNDELLQMAAVVKDNGVFNGNAGKLDPTSNITRENMAVVLVRAFDTVKGIDLVSYVAAQEFDKDVTDLEKAKAEARPAIDVLDYFDITNPAAPNFNPKNTTTRGQFASLLHKAMGVNYNIDIVITTATSAGSALSPMLLDFDYNVAGTVADAEVKEVVLTFTGNSGTAKETLTVADGEFKFANDGAKVQFGDFDKVEASYGTGEDAKTVTKEIKRSER